MCVCVYVRVCVCVCVCVRACVCVCVCVYLTETRHEFILVMLTVVHKKNELMFNIPFFCTQC